MKTLIAFTILVITSSASAADFPKFMSGSWRASFDGTRVEEHWTSADGGVMLATSKTVSKDGKTSFEFLRIQEKNGKLSYLAQPQGRPETVFPVKSMTASRVVFENPEHDFPQRVIYWRDKDKLCARIEGKMNGKDEGEEWCWEKY